MVDLCTGVGAENAQQRPTLGAEATRRNLATPAEEPADEPAPELRLRSAALRTQSEHVDDVICLRETVIRGDRLGPAFNGIRLDLHRQATAATDQVVMVLTGSAGAIQALAIGRLQRVGLSLDREIRERTVHRREPDRGPGIAQTGMQSLSADEAIVAAERLANRFALPGVALHDQILLSSGEADSRPLLPPRTRRCPITRQTR